MSRLFGFLTEDQVLRLQQRQLAPSAVLTLVLALRVFSTPLLRPELSWLHAGIQLLVVAALIYMAATTRNHLLVAGSLGIATLLLEVLQLLDRASHPLELLRVATMVALLIYVFWLMIRDLFTASRVDATILLLAANCYLVIGMLWSVFYTVVETEIPGSFVMAGDPSTPVWQNLYYFSFVTLTTLGYGDIQPVGPLARSLAMMQAVGGVLFTGILVARLVGMYGAKRDEA